MITLDTPIRISNAYKTGIMDRVNPPAAYCNDGDTVIFETMDCSDGAVRRDGTRDRTPGKFLANPATGPLFVNGAEPNDTLEVEILSIKIGNFGYMGTGFVETFFNDTAEYPIHIFDVEDGHVKLGGHIFPIRPMIGVIGVAPAGDGIDTETPHAHGGNMDCTLIREGSKLYLPVSAKGALLAMGDLHAIMGDGEVALYGLEVPGEVTVKVHVIKEHPLSWPCVICDDRLSVIASAKTTDECIDLALNELYRILTLNGWSKADARYLMSLKCDLAVCQIVDPNKTVRASIDMEFLKPKTGTAD